MTRSSFCRGAVGLAFIALFGLLRPVVASPGSVDRSESELRVEYRGPLYPDRLGEEPEIAIYDGKGTWTAGKEGFKHFLTSEGISYRTISAKEIQQGGLDAYEALFMPGGESWEYLAELGETGAQTVRNYVSSGGSYMGICAGAFYATSRREGGQATGPYGIGLLEGTAYDGTALHTPPFVEGVLRFDLASLPLLSGLSAHYHWLLLGGPSFRYTDEEARKKKIQVLARFQDIDEPAMILLQYGQGRVFLSAPHVEVEPGTTDSVVDRDDTQDSGWPILERVTNYELGRN